MNRRELLHDTAIGGFTALIPSLALRGSSLAANTRTLTLQAYPLAGQSLDSTVLGDIQQVLADRIKYLKSPGATVSVQTDGLVTITITGTDPGDDAIAAIVRRNFVEIIDPRGDYLAVGTAVTTSLSGPPWTPPETASPAPATPAATTTYETIVSSADIADAAEVTNSLGQTVVGFRFTPDGGDRFYTYSSAHLGQPISIVVDNVVVNTATLNDAIRTNGIIEGLPPDDAHALIASLNTSPLPAHLVVIDAGE